MRHRSHCAHRVTAAAVNGHGPGDQRSDGPEVALVIEKACLRGALRPEIHGVRQCATGDQIILEEIAC